MATNHVIFRDIGWGLHQDPNDDTINIISATDGIKIIENGIALDPVNTLTNTSITRALSALMGTQLDQKKLDNGGYTGTGQDIVDNKMDKMRIINGADLNLLKEPGFYAGISLINCPTDFDQNYMATMIVIKYDANNFSQILIQSHELTPKLFYRTHSSTTSFSNWAQMSTVGMIDGIGSLKLDKVGDTATNLKCVAVPVDPQDVVRKEDLDSVHNEAISNYVIKSGDTMTGQLNTPILRTNEFYIGEVKITIV